MRLPKLPNNIRHGQVQTVQFGGLNLTPKAKEGEFVSCAGVSPADQPFITQMPARVPMNRYESPMDMYAWNGSLYVVDGTQLMRDSETLGTISAGNKCFAVVNTKLVIFPDKVYVDLNDNSIHSLITKDHTYTTYTITDSTITATGIGSDFAEGDVLDITGEGISGKHIVVQSVAADSLTFVTGSIDLDTYSGSVNVKSSVPDLDFICASNNRLWGCSNTDHTVYASALGDPTSFFDYGSDIGSFSTAISPDGLFTAICEYNNQVLVWKEEKLYKFLGSYPSEYYMVESSIPGVKAGDDKSLVVVNGLLYYSGIYGIYVYNGNRPQIISENLGMGSYVVGSGKVSGFSDVCCATDGRLLYVGCFANSAGDAYDAPWPTGAQLFLYDLINGIWVNELDCGSYIWRMVSIGRKIYALHWGEARGANNYITESGYTITTRQTWYVEFAQVTENTFNRKGYTKLHLRLDMKPGSTVRVLAREDDREYREVYSESLPSGEMTKYVDETVVIGSTPASFTALSDYTNLWITANAMLNGKPAEYTSINDDYVLTALFDRYTLKIDFPNGTISVLDNWEDGRPLAPGEYQVIVFTEYVDGPAEGGVKTIPIRLGRCDRYQIRIEGTGEVTIRTMGREFVAGGDIN